MPTKRYVVQIRTVEGTWVILEGDGNNGGSAYAGRGPMLGHSSAGAAIRQARKVAPSRVWDRKLKRVVMTKKGRIRITDIIRRD